jgi:gluconokinase
LVLACSALKESYRKILGVDQKCVISVYLKGSHEILAERIKMREHRFMNKGLLDSQLAAMEAPRDGVVIDITMTPDRICRQIIGRLEQIEEITRPPSA